MKIPCCAIWIGLCLALAGCQGLFGPKGPPRDPLLSVHKPLEGRAVAGPPTVIAYSEPEMPRHAGAIEDQPAYAGSTPRRIPGVLTNRVRNPHLRDAPKEP